MRKSKSGGNEEETVSATCMWAIITCHRVCLHSTSCPWGIHSIVKQEGSLSIIKLLSNTEQLFVDCIGTTTVGLLL